MAKNVPYDKCKFHPNRVAHVRCKTCHIPLCDECKVVTNMGIFCSEECHKKAQEFQERVGLQNRKPKKTGSPVKTLFGIIVIVVLIVLIALGLDFLGFTLPFVEQLKGVIGLG